MHGGDLVAATLAAHQVPAVYTLCGGHISPILVSCAAHGIRVIDTRHEATAVFAADATARLTGRPGVAAVTAGPGLSNTITAVKNAQLAQSPLVLLGGATATILKGRGALQDIDQMALIRPHVKWAATARRVADIPQLLQRAFAIAQHGVPGPVFLELPVDLLYAETTVREWYLNSLRGNSLAARAMRGYAQWHLGRVFAAADTAQAADPLLPAPLSPPDAQVGQAAVSLSEARRPVLLLGPQALLEVEKTTALIGAVERLGVPVYLTGGARGLLGRSHRLLLRHQRRAALKEADLVILAGVPADFRLDYGRVFRRAKVIAVNRSPAELRRNLRPHLAIHADVGRLLAAVAPLAPTPTRWESWLAQLRLRDESREAEIARQAEQPTLYINPLHLCRKLDAYLPDDAMLIGDGGDFVATAAYTVAARGPLRWLDPGPFGTLGVGAGFAIGAAVALPDTPIWVVFGDGALGYSLIEFDTFVRHNLPVTAIVGNDAGWTQIARDQVTILGSPLGTELAPTDYHTAAIGLGAAGFYAEDPATLDTILSETCAAAAAGHPVLLNARIGIGEFRKGSLSI